MADLVGPCARATRGLRRPSLNARTWEIKQPALRLASLEGPFQSARSMCALKDRPRYPYYEMGDGARAQ